jgi:protoheme IX farnesyltransferase
VTLGIVNTIKAFTLLTKPGIILGNAITAVGGFALASRDGINPFLLFVTVIGLSLVIASSCVFNNCIDKENDERMERTKNRELVKGVLTRKDAMIFGLLLGVSGIVLLGLFTSFFIVSLSLTGFFVYVVLYSLFKYRSFYGTLVGSISGGVPPVVGYCATGNTFDEGAVLLFLIMFFWQIPHFFAIALYRHDEHADSFIVLSVKKERDKAKIHMVMYISLFIASALLLTLCGYAGQTYRLVALTFGGTWLFLCIRGCVTTSWARQLFHFSLVMIAALFVAISVEKFIL